LKPAADGTIILTVDFGAEVDAFLELDVTTRDPSALLVWFGESMPEVDGFIASQHPDPRSDRYLPKAGRHRLRFEQRGFRFVRLIFNDIRGEVTLHNLSAQALFTFQRRDGDFQCSDRRFQRVWQTSAYCARVCTQADTVWDGIKRDRGGWFGDARVIKLAVDHVFFDPRPAEAMMSSLPSDCWGNRIPNYSFDAAAMLKQHILFYGLDRLCVKECYRRLKALLAWTKRTQVDKTGFLTRTDHEYFHNIGFLDWSSMPVGGRFEELSWLQIKYLEGLRNTIDIALLLKDSNTAHALQKDADRLAKRIMKRFWKDGVGMIHSLNYTGEWSCISSGTHYQKTYIDKIQKGPSGPSRHSNAVAVWAGLATPAMKEIILKKVFNSQSIPPLITAYFEFFEQSARAECGDRRGAIMHMRDYVGTMLEQEETGTLWEVYDPTIRDLRKYSSDFTIKWEWAASLCHGWGAGAIPIAARYLLGIEPTSPGYRTVALNPLLELPWTFCATIPTPEGTITVERDKPDGAVRYSVPKGIAVTAGTGAEVRTPSASRAPRSSGR
jgi:hypothetical protein